MGNLNEWALHSRTDLVSVVGDGFEEGAGGWLCESGLQGHS